MICASWCSSYLLFPSLREDIGTTQQSSSQPDCFLCVDELTRVFFLAVGSIGRVNSVMVNITLMQDEGLFVVVEVGEQC